MNKNILRKFAMESRQELMEKVENKIKMFYVNEEFTKEQSGDVVVLTNEKHLLRLTSDDYKKRELLIKRIEELSLEQVIEEAAYTWFNRIVAIRYMEINDMLPLTRKNTSLGIRVLSSKDNTVDPEILKFSNLNNPDLDINFKREEYVEKENDNEKFKYVLLLVCKKLGMVIPQVYSGLTDYIDILMPDNLLNDSGFVTKIINEVPQDCYDDVEIIGWLYQYYISEKKSIAFSKLKKQIKISKQDIPAATQLFTPKWIVKYMVENSLGRYTSLQDEFEYYIGVKENDIKEIKNIEDIKFMDPCCGSGNILVYALEVFYKEYLKRGYTSKKALENILTKNLFGIDIDERAVQLATLTLSLRAGKLNKDIFNTSVIKNMNVIYIMSSNSLNRELYTYSVPEKYIEPLDYIYNTFLDASDYGSLIRCDKLDYNKLLNDISHENFIGLEQVTKLINQAIILSNQYDVVVTNPPYMGRKNINKKLSVYLAKNYKNTKSEMYSAFMERCSNFTVKDGYQAMVTIHTWMFISSFKNLRDEFLKNGTFINMIHTGPATFPDLNSANVISTTFCYKKSNLDIDTTFVRLTEYNEEEKITNFRNKSNYYYLKQKVLKEIPGSPFIYYISDNIRNKFKENKTLGEFYPPKQGLATGDNDVFLRTWHEVDINKIGFGFKKTEDAHKSGLEWFPYNKGGNYRKWYGNNADIIRFDSNSYKELLNSGNHLPSREFYFEKGITWSLFGFSNFGVRYKDYGFVFDVSGSSMFPDEENLYYVIGYLCSNVAFKFLYALAPTVNFQIGNIASLPFKNCNNKERINELVKENIAICREEWDLHETSWDFKTHVLLRNKEKNLKEAYIKFEEHYNNLRNKLRENEEELNRIYSQIFDVENEVDVTVLDRDLSLPQIDKCEVIKSFISYAVGCMFGRYSLDKPGLVFAGGEFNFGNYKEYKPTEDNIILITDEEYFIEDIVVKFKEFLKKIFGKENLSENLEFIAECLGRSGNKTSEEIIRKYFCNNFYADHTSRYSDKPIYWLFDSGKKKGFKCLMYMHRYNENLVPKIRLDYLNKVQTIYEKMLFDINDKLTTQLSMPEKKELKKIQGDLSAKLHELIEYADKIVHIANERIDINLDDGVIENYNKFADVLAKIK